MTRWSRHVMPSGMVVSLAMPDPEVTYGTYVGPTRFIPLKGPDVLRAEAAAKVLAVFRELGVDPQHDPESGANAARGRTRRLKPEPCPAFADLGALKFELEFPLTPREPSRLGLYGALMPPLPVLPWSGII